MANELIEQMVELVEQGYTPLSVWESTLTYHAGSAVKVNKATTGKDPETGSSIAVPEGTVVTIVGVGGGESGNDPHVQLPSGQQAIIPFYDLGEGEVGLSKGDALDEDVQEELTGVVHKVTLSKPLPQGAVDWLASGYMDYGVELPDTPSDDSASAVSFLMKGEDEETVEAALEGLKKEAGTSFKSSSAATMVDWSATMAG